MNVNQINKILVPVDFSELTIPVFETAVQIAKRQNSSLTLLHVLEPLVGLSIDVRKSSGDRKKEAQRVAIDKLNAIADLVREGENLEINIKTLFGNATGKIVEEAGRTDYDLIIIGAHGASGFRQYFIGSTAYRVLKNSPCGVMTIPYEKMESFKKVLFPVRLIPQALEKYEFVRELIIRNQSELVVVGLISTSASEEDTNIMKDQLVEFMNRLNEDGVANRTWITQTDNFSDEALKQAKEVNADLIVVTADLDFVMRDYFVGPFVQQVVNHSDIPVLSIRPTKSEMNLKLKKDSKSNNLDSIIDDKLAGL